MTAARGAKGKGTRGLPRRMTVEDRVRLISIVDLVHEIEDIRARLASVFASTGKPDDTEEGWRLALRLDLLEREAAHATRGWEPRRIAGVSGSEPETVAWLLSAFVPLVRRDPPPPAPGVEVWLGVRLLNPRRYQEAWDAVPLVPFVEPYDAKRVATELFQTALADKRVTSQTRVRERAAALIGVLRGRDEGPDAILELARIGAPISSVSK